MLVLHLNGQEPPEKCPVPAKGESQFLCRNAVAAIPLAFKARTFCGKPLGEPFHCTRYKLVRALYRLSRLINKTHLDGIPLTSKAVRLFRRKQRSAFVGIIFVGEVAHRVLCVAFIDKSIFMVLLFCFISVRQGRG